MDRYRSPYKENASILNQAQHNRELQNPNRAKSRREMFESGRNIEVRHTPRKVAMPQDVEVKNQILEKENIGVVCNVKNEKSEEPKPHENDWNKSRIALAKKVNPKIATKQETFLLKFIKWKEAHKLKEKKIEPKRRPFAGGGVGGMAIDNNTRKPAVSSNVNNKVASFVPKGHTTFKAPPGLRSPTANMTSEARDLYAHDRKSFYTLVPTPPRQELKKSTALNKTPCVSKLGLSNTPATAAMKTNLKPVNATKSQSTVKTGTIPKTCTKPTALVAPTTKTLGRVLTNPSTASKTTTPACGVPKSNARTNNVGVTVPLKKNGSVENPIANHLKSAHKFTKPQPSKKAIAITQTKSVAHERKFCATAAAKTQKTASTGITTGAVGKAHLLQSKRPAAVTATTIPNEQRNAKFATSFKAKKIQVSTFYRPNAPNKMTIKGKTLLGGGVRPCKTDAVFAIAETPTDLLNINPYEPFVTSTRLKSLPPHKSNAPNISPIGKELDGMAVTKSGQQKHQNIRATHGSTSAKRTLLTNEVKPCIQNPPSQLQRQKSKFNFIRYSARLSELDTSYENEMKIEEEEKKDLTEFKSAQQMTLLEVKPMQVIKEDNLAMPLQSGTNCKLSSDKTPTSNESERRVSVVVRDRKSLSAAATVITLPGDSAVASAVAAQRRISRLFAANGVSESPRSLHSYSNELRCSISNMEKAFGNCSDLRRTTLSGNAHKALRRSGTPNFVESPLGTGVNQQPQQPESCTPPPATIGGRKSILKTPGIAKGKRKSVICSKKLRVKKLKFTFEDDDKLSDEEELMKTINEAQ